MCSLLCGDALVVSLVDLAHPRGKAFPRRRSGSVLQDPHTVFYQYEDKARRHGATCVFRNLFPPSSYLQKAQSVLLNNQ